MTTTKGHPHADWQEIESASRTTAGTLRGWQHTSEGGDFIAFIEL